MHWLEENALVPVIATITWRFAAEYVQDRYGFAAASGCEMNETNDGILLGTVSRHFEAEDKITFVREFANRFDLDFRRVVAVGDSTSDIPLFREAGLAIALNASSNAREAADVALDTKDLRDVIPLIENHFSKPIK
jgi:phosphoserine phosphatase